MFSNQKLIFGLFPEITSENSNYQNVRLANSDVISSNDWEIVKPKRVQTEGLVYEIY